MLCVYILISIQTRACIYATSAVLQILQIYVFLAEGFVVCCSAKICTYVFQFTVFVDILIVSLFLSSLYVFELSRLKVLHCNLLPIPISFANLIDY
jgi:hypothetical protein